MFGEQVVIKNVLMKLFKLIFNRELNRELYINSGLHITHNQGKSVN